MLTRPLFCLLLVVLFASCRMVSGEDVSFTQDVRPILAKHCLACHGADADARQGDLRLDVPADRTDLRSPAARAIVPGNVEQSELIHRIMTTDPETKMPPPDSGHELKPDDIRILRQWIADGAVYETHWAFVPPQRTTPPLVSNEAWCRSPIDRFVLHALEQQQLQPASRANAETLVRRIALDLTGLPPSEQQVTEFLQKPLDEAVEKLADELLQSPHFGEHWARMWLDLARYADTKGYEKDQPRTMWRYRDWVIQAFNADMPFDQFTREQLAGDLLPNATADQILATAFHRNTMTNDEGGTDNEEFRMAAVKDRVDTTVQVWMGLTMGCAKCHSHKYDPISQREYYQFLAYFDQTEDEDRPDDSPKLATPTPEQAARLEGLRQQLASVRRDYNVTSPEFLEAKRQWEAELTESPAWRVCRPTMAESENGSTLTIQDDHSVLASGTRPATEVYTITVRSGERPLTAANDADTDAAASAAESNAAQVVSAIRLEALTHKSLPKGGPGRTGNDPNFVLSELTVEVIDEAGNAVQELTLQSAKADFSQNNWDVTKAIDGDEATGWAISPQQGQPHVAVFGLAEPVTISAGHQLRLKLSQQYSGNSLLLGCVRFSNSDQPFEQLSADPLGLSELASIPAENRTAEQANRLDEAFRKIAPQTAELGRQLTALEEQLKALNAQIPQTPIMKDRPETKARTSYVHVRGNFLEHGDVVTPALPAAFPVSTAELPDNRLAVADWLLAEQNPLTARVMVNRLWARIFGRGIVETEEDFGQQGMLPTHPELLDWLAVEFRTTHRWSVKSFLRSLVMSSTYQQSSRVTQAAQKADPDNRWLSRSPRFRLPAETVRDQALVVSGLLTRSIGGPSVMPPQPDGIWKATYSSLKWETAEDQNRWRRGLYTFLRRTSPYPSMITFDGGSGEVCQIRRIRTNTPLQALVTLNDPVYVEAAGGLAFRSANDAAGDSSPADVISKMFRRAIIRSASAAERDRLLKLWTASREEFDGFPSFAAELLAESRVTPNSEGVSPTEMAAYVVVGNVILNLDEALMRP